MKIRKIAYFVFKGVNLRVFKRKQLFAEPLGCLKYLHDEEVMFVAEKAKEKLFIPFYQQSGTVSKHCAQFFA